MSGGSGETQVAGFADELSVSATTFIGTYLSAGVLLENPVQIIFDNQTDVVAELSVNGTSTCKTLQPGQNVTLDMSSNKGPTNNFTFVVGKEFFVKGVGGTGNFLISYTFRDF